jgi:hypothetical protein
MTEIMMTKRKAMPGEVGLFVSAEIWEEDFATIKIGAECKAVVTVPANLVYLRYFWALCDKIADNCSWVLDKDDAKDKLLLKIRHAGCYFDPCKERWEVRSKSIANLSGDTWIRLLKRCSHAVTEHFIPGMPEGLLKAEIEKMISEKVDI